MKKNRTSLALSFISLLAAACGANEAPALPQVVYDDVAVAVGNLVANPWGSETFDIFNSMVIAQGPSKPIEEPDTFEPGEAPASIWYHGNLVAVYYGTCHDADDVALFVCGDTATDIDVETTWTGSFDAPLYMVLLNRTGTWTITGLRGEVAELQGSSTFDIESHIDGIYWPGTRDLQLTYDTAYQGLRINTEKFRVVDGTIRYTIGGVHTSHLADGDRQVDVDVEAVLTVRDEFTADLVIEGKYVYFIDMYTGVITTVHGHAIDVLLPY